MIPNLLSGRLNCEAKNTPLINIHPLTKRFRYGPDHISLQQLRTKINIPWFAQIPRKPDNLRRWCSSTS